MSCGRNGKHTSGGRGEALQAFFRAPPGVPRLRARFKVGRGFWGARTFMMHDSIVPESASRTWPHSFLVKPVSSAHAARIAVFDIASLTAFTIDTSVCLGNVD